MFEKILLCLLLLNSTLNIETDTKIYMLSLNKNEPSIDGHILTETPYNGVSIHNGENIDHYAKEYDAIPDYGDAEKPAKESEKHTKEECNLEKLVKISQPGTYQVSGSLKGQLCVELASDGEEQNVTLILNNLDIESKVAPGLLFKTAHEIDTNKYKGENEEIQYEAAIKLNFEKAGAKVIIADGSYNTIKGSHVAKVNRYTENADGTITIDPKKKKKYKYDGAFYSKVSMSIKGQSKGDGVLNVIGDQEGLDSEKHLLIEGGRINIAAQDDGINGSEDKGSVVLVKGGTLTVNGGLGSQGDGIDSNGMLIIQGGTVYTGAAPKNDCGLDADLGIIINGGNVIGLGSTKYGASMNSKQPTMNLKFAGQVKKNSKLIIKDSSKNEIVAFTATSLGFLEGTDVRKFSGVVISHPSFKLDGVYYVELDGVELNGKEESSKLISNKFKLIGTSTTFDITNQIATDSSRYINFSFGSIIALLMILF